VKHDRKKTINGVIYLVKDSSLTAASDDVTMALAATLIFISTQTHASKMHRKRTMQEIRILSPPLGLGQRSNRPILLETPLYLRKAELSKKGGGEGMKVEGKGTK
jgi:hypothetical protein